VLHPWTDSGYLYDARELQTYSVQEGKVTDQITVTKEFDRIASDPRPNALTISTVPENCPDRMLQPVYKIDVTNAPFKRAPDAPVNPCRFDAYQ